MRSTIMRFAASRAWLDVSVMGRAPRRIEIELFASKCPMAAENFSKLCTGENKLPFTAAKDAIHESTFKDQFLPQLSYEKSLFHRVCPGFLVQGGDVTGNGLGNISIFGEEFDAPAELGAVPFDRPGLVGTAVSAPHKNGSQFFILTREKGAPHLDGTCICFGRVTKGFEIVKEIEALPVDFEGRPERGHVVIEAAGSS